MTAKRKNINVNIEMFTVTTSPQTDLMSGNANMIHEASLVYGFGDDAQTIAQVEMMDQGENAVLVDLCIELGRIILTLQANQEKKI